MSKKKRFVLILFIALVLLVVVSLIYDSMYPEEKVSVQEPTPTLTVTPTPLAESDECTLKAKVEYSSSQLQVSNLGANNWADVVIELNSGVIFGGYSYTALKIETGKTYTIGLAQFTDKKGNRFNPFEKKVQSVFITDRATLCDYFAEVK